MKVVHCHSGGGVFFITITTICDIDRSINHQRMVILLVPFFVPMFQSAWDASGSELDLLDNMVCRISLFLMYFVFNGFVLLTPRSSIWSPRWFDAWRESAFNVMETAFFCSSAT